MYRVLSIYHRLFSCSGSLSLHNSATKWHTRITPILHMKKLRHREVKYCMEMLYN